jgi:hypothetical protein
VDFKLASDSGAELVFVNPGKADHLKRIVYRRPGTGQLAARIEGEDGGKPFSVDYVSRVSRRLRVCEVSQVTEDDE